MNKYLWTKLINSSPPTFHGYVDTTIESGQIVIYRGWVQFKKTLLPPDSEAKEKLEPKKGGISRNSSKAASRDPSRPPSAIDNHIDYFREPVTFYHRQSQNVWVE